MKQFSAVLAVFLAALFCGGAFAQIQVKLHDYSLTVSTSPRSVDGGVGFITSLPLRPAKGEKPFGFWYAENQRAMSAAVMEISDASSKKMIRSISTADVTGKGTTETFDDGKRVVTTYEFGAGANQIGLQVEAITTTDPALPLGKKTSVQFRVMPSKNGNLVLTLKLKTDGIAGKLGTSSVGTTKAEKNMPKYPTILLASSFPVTVKLEKRDVKNQIQGFSITSQSVSAAEKTWTTLLSFDVVETTVHDAEKTLAQANNVTDYFTAKQERPELALFNVASSTTTSPGDTITYTIIYHNIGSALAQDAEVSNPIPVGVRYVEGSAESTDADVIVDRTPATAPGAVGEATMVRWKIKKQILPGEEGRVSMKVVVR